MKIAIITGASSGMGQSFVSLIKREVDHLDEVWLIGRRQERLTIWQKKYPDFGFQPYALDLTKEEDLLFLSRELEGKNARVEIFIHAAGFGIMGRLDEISRQEQEEMVDVNIRSVVSLTSILLPYMNTGSQMIYFASAAAFLPQPGFSLYAASKAFVLSYVRSLRAENCGRKLRITAVCPGAVKTEFFHRADPENKLPAYKRMVMAQADPVVKKAWKDNKKNREISIYGLPMKAFALSTKILPHNLFLAFLGGKSKNEK